MILNSEEISDLKCAFLGSFRFSDTLLYFYYLFEIKKKELQNVRSLIQNTILVLSSKK